MINDEIAVSFNIVLSSEVEEELIKAQNLLAKEIKDRRFYDNSPHLAICTKFMFRPLVKRYLSVIEEAFGDLKKFEIVFAGFGASDTGNYIFLNLEDLTKQYIFDLNEKTKFVSKGIGNETPGGLPSKYPFDPHISIIKLEEFQVNRALQLLNKEFKVSKMLVEELEISVEQRDSTGFATFSKDLNLKLK